MGKSQSPARSQQQPSPQQSKKHNKKKHSDSDNDSNSSRNNNNNNKNNNNSNQQQQQQQGRSGSASGIIRHTHGHITEADFYDFSPRTVMGGVVLLSVLFIVFRYTYSTDAASNIKVGLLAAMWSFVVFGMMHFPDSIMVRPHPIVWRGFMALLVLYMMTIVFFLFQDYKTTRMIIGLYDPKSLLEENDNEKSWAEDCRITTPEKPYLFFETVFDEFMLAHLLGYWGKMLVLRDWKMVMFVSVGFEIVEYSLQYLMPNFKECWWDHVIADLILCNAGGAFLGWLTLKAVGAKEYDFVALENIRSIPGKAKRVMAQLMPRSLDRFQWEMFDSLKRFSQVSALLFVMLFGELNSFITKLLWNLPPTDLLVNLRLQVIGWAAISGVREYYDWVSTESKRPTRMGPMAWLIFFVWLLESLWCLKMIHESKHHYFQRVMPAHVAVPWIVALSLFAFWVVAFFSTKSFRKQKSTSAWMWRGIITIVFYSVFLCIFGMCFMGTPMIGDWYRDEFDKTMAKWQIWVV